MASKIVRNISKPILSNTNRFTRLSKCNSSHITWLKVVKSKGTYKYILETQFFHYLKIVDCVIIMTKISFVHMILDPVMFVKKNSFESKKQFTSSASKYNEMENIISTETVLLSDSCVERIKEIADDTSYLRVMVRH